VSITITIKYQHSLKMALKTFTTADGSANQALVTNGSGVLSYAAVGGGKVLQVVQYSLAGQIQTTSGSPVTTGLTGSITPSSASSKILILVSMTCCYQTVTNAVGNTTIYRGATDLGAGSPKSFGDTYSTSGGITTGQSYQYLDSPNTTSSTTYTIYFFTGGTFNINQNGNTSYMNLIEIGA
jgi:hypothetical protein